MNKLSSTPTKNEFKSEPLRSPPQNIEAEQALLGAIMINNKAYDDVSDYLKKEHFSYSFYGKVFESASKLIEQGQNANPISLSTYLEKEPEIVEKKGFNLLTELANSTVTIINAKEYGRIIYDLYLRRELIDLGQVVVNNAFEADPDQTAVNQIEITEQRLFELSSNTDSINDLNNFDDAISSAIKIAEAAYKRDDSLAGTTTGLLDLDSKLGGLHSSDLIILAGRPSMGKTALATTVAYNASKYFQETNKEEDKGKKVAFFSLEMSEEQLATRLLAEKARINSHDIRTGRLNEDEFDKLILCTEKLRGLPLMIDDSPALTIAAIRTRCRRLARASRNNHHKGLGLIVIDYLQLLDPGKRNQNDNRVQEISAISRGLKALAKDLDVPVLALSQLSRAVEQREDKRPQLADLRESGSIEQDADVVMFVYRDEYYLEKKMPQESNFESSELFQQKLNKWQNDMDEVHNKAEVIVGKQRHGPVGKVLLHFQPEYTHFSNHSHQEMEKENF
ncbi:MAG: replicative DNA helicase [Pseudomonadota bacterium]|nr:replicative DNA helicase [Pseudomonadota bacterium]